MTIATWLKISTKLLQSCSVPTASLDSEVFLAAEVNKDRSWVLAHPEHELTSDQVERLDQQITRRCKHEPLAYIRGAQEFYGRNFVVSPDTLTPRPETETLVEMALNILKKNEITSVADIGSGSGCIIITLSLESESKSNFTGYEVSEPAIEIAKKNAQLLHSNATFIQADIAAGNGVWKDAEMIVANLPYVPSDFKINLAATHEPTFAIYGGVDGLDYYRSMFSKLSSKVQHVVAESLPPQHAELETIADEAGFKLKNTQDLIQYFTR